MIQLLRDEHNVSVTKIRRKSCLIGYVQNLGNRITDKSLILYTKERIHPIGPKSFVRMHLYKSP